MPGKQLTRKLPRAPHRAKAEHVAVRKTQQKTIPPTLSPFQGIRYLQRQIERFERQIVSLPQNDPDVEGWVSMTKDILNQTFGQPDGAMHSKTSDFVFATGGLQSDRLRLGDHVNREYARRLYVMTQQKRKMLLNEYIEQLQDHAPTSSATALDLYVFHSEIEIVSSHLYRNGHYKQAALKANHRLIDEVRRASGISDDGDSLINKVFGIDRQNPIIQFNSLETEAQREEQRGTMHLFKGIVGLCDSKGQCDHLFDDPFFAHEYLALASLLMRKLETAQINKEPQEIS
jgi:uncharacterized protein (TIGR02391 family)